MTKKMGGVVHAGDVELHDNSHGENFGGRFARIGAAAGGAQLRTSVYEIAPGRRAFPHHAHHGIEEALYAYTWGSSYANFEEERKGSLEPGKLADLTVLSRNLLAIEPREILDTEVLYTIVDGEVVYQHGSSS